MIKLYFTKTGTIYDQTKFYTSIDTGPPYDRPRETQRHEFLLLSFFVIIKSH